MSKTFDSMPAKAFFMNSRGLLSLRKRIFKYTVCKDGKLFHSRLSDAILIFLITRKLEKHMAIHKISPSDYSYYCASILIRLCLIPNNFSTNIYKFRHYYKYYRSDNILAPILTKDTHLKNE